MEALFIEANGSQRRDQLDEAVIEGLTLDGSKATVDPVEGDTTIVPPAPDPAEYVVRGALFDGTPVLTTAAHGVDEVNMTVVVPNTVTAVDAAETKLRQHAEQFMLANRADGTQLDYWLGIPDVDADEMAQLLVSHQTKRAVRVLVVSPVK